MYLLAVNVLLVTLLPQELLPDASEERAGAESEAGAGGGAGAVAAAGGQHRHHHQSHSICYTENYYKYANVPPVLPLQSREY